MRGRCAGAERHSFKRERSPRAGAQSRLEDDETSDVDGANYQLEMMRCLREVNVDNNTVGWCAALGRHASSRGGAGLRAADRTAGGGVEARTGCTVVPQV